MKSSIDDGIRLLIAAGVASLENVVGCTEDDIREVESEFGFPLPRAYRLYLLKLGRGCGEFTESSDCTFPDVLHLKQVAEESIAGNVESRLLIPSHFIFLSHHDHAFLGFDARGGDDPTVFRYIDGDSSLKEVFPSFTEWFAAAVADELAGQNRAQAQPNQKI